MGHGLTGTGCGPYNRPMNVFIEPTDRRIAPFDDPIGDVRIHNRALSYWQERAIAEAGLTVIASREPPCLVLPDNFFASGAALRAFVDGAAGRNAVLVLKESVFGRTTVPVQLGVVAVAGGWRFEAIRFEAGRDDDPVDVVVDPREKVTKVPFPRAFTGEATLEIGLPQVPVMTLHHWVHILWANQFTGTVELFATPRWKLILRGLWAVLRALSFNKWKVLAKFTRLGKGCDIHPTAVVEGCTLGDNVTVGAFCHLQFSTLGDGVTIMPGAQVGASVIGDNAWVSEDCVLRFSVLYPGAIASQRILQHSILGRDAATTAGSGTIDFSFGGPIKVTLDGKLKSTGARFVGGAFGHRSRLGAGITLSAGRSIPNDTMLVADPKTILSHIPSGHAGTPLIASGNRAMPATLLRRRAPRPKDTSH